MSTKIINKFGCFLPNWLFPFKRKYSSILMSIEVAPEYINGEATQTVADLHITFGGVSVEEIQRILGGKGSVFKSKNEFEWVLFVVYLII